MARNKREIDRQAKQDAIVAAARTAFLTAGYEGASMAQVARAAGVAPNTLYWYFDDKDDLLIAVLEQRVGEALRLRDDRIRTLPLAEQLIWLIDCFEEAKPLVQAVHARMEASARVREWHERFHQMVDLLATAELTARGLDPAQASAMATAGTFIVEGLLSHPHQPVQREQVLRWLLRDVPDALL